MWTLASYCPSIDSGERRRSQKGKRVLMNCVAKVHLEGHTVKRATSVTVVLALIVATLAEAQNPQSPVPPTPTQVTKPAPTRPTLEDGTPIKLRLGETLSSANEIGRAS